MALAPPCGSAQLRGARRQPLEVAEVATTVRPVVGRRVELEVDLIDAVSKPDLKGAVVSMVGARLEARRESQAEEGGRPRVQPVGREVQGERHIRDGLHECGGQGLGLAEAARIHTGDHVEVLRASVREAQEDQGAATDQDKGGGLAPSGEDRAEDVEGFIEG